MSLFHQVLQRTGLADKTVDPEFDEGLAQYQRSKLVTESLSKSTKRYGDSLRVLNGLQYKVATDLVKATQDIEENVFVKDLANMFGTNMSRPIRDHEVCVRQVFQEPFSRYSKLFPSINDLIKARAHNMLKFDRCRYKYNGKRQKEEHPLVTSARADFQKLNSILIREFKDLFDATVDQFIPSFYDFMQMQVRVYFLLDAAATENEMMESQVEALETEAIQRAIDDIRDLGIVASRPPKADRRGFKR